MKIDINTKKLFNEILDQNEWDELVLLKNLIIGELKVRAKETKCPACKNPILRYDVKFCAFCGEEVAWIPNEDYFNEDIIIKEIN